MIERDDRIPPLVQLLAELEERWRHLGPLMLIGGPRIYGCWHMVMCGHLQHAGLADNVLGPQETDVAKGNDILGQIFGSKDVSRTVAGHAAGQTGIDPELLKKMLPILAMLVGGYLSSRAGGQGEGQGGGGILGSILGSVLGGGQQQAAPSGGGGLLGGLGSLIDLNHDGNPLDDIIGMAGKLAR